MMDSQASVHANCSPNAVSSDEIKMKSPSPKPSTEARTPKKPKTSKPPKSSPSPKSKQTNNTTRTCSRPTPVRSLSSPLARSLSARVAMVTRSPTDPRSAVSTTYRDAFKSPKELSYKLQSLNLEIPIRALSGTETGLDTSTTYRDSYQWRLARTPESPSAHPVTERHITSGYFTRSASERKPKTNHVNTTAVRVLETSATMNNSVPLIVATPSRTNNERAEPNSPSPWLHSVPVEMAKTRHTPQSKDSTLQYRYR